MAHIYRSCLQPKIVSDFEKMTKSPSEITPVEYAGAFGENQVLTELKKLDDDFFVVCGLTIELPYYVTYKSSKNLRSAEMDFIVVGTTGIFVIEVKNWSNEYLKNYMGLSTYEQIDRAGLVLYIFLNGYFSSAPKITKIIVPIQGNIFYNKNYKTVFIKNIENLNNFICKRKTIYSPSTVKKILSLIP